MHIYEKGAVFKSSNSDIEIECSVLVADIFELNTDFKAMIVVDVDEFNYEHTPDDKTLKYMEDLSKCDIFECNATAMGNNFRCNFKNVIVDADYGNGSILRLFVHIEGYEHYECRVTDNYYDNMVALTE